MKSGQRRAVLYVTGVLVGAALLATGFGITVPPDPETRLNGASLLADGGQYDRALKIVDIVEREHPGNLDALVYRATILAMAGRHEEAVRAYDAAIDAARGEEDLRLNLRQDRASVLLAADRLDEFREERARLRSEGAGHRADLLEGLEATRSGDPAGAAAAYRRALQQLLGQSKDDASVTAHLWHALMDAGRVALAHRRFGEAAKYFDEACALAPSATQAHRMAAETRLAQDDPRGAAALLEGLPSTTPGIAPILFRAATTLLVEGAHEEAITLLRQANHADATGTKSLCETESAWDAFRGDARVQDALAEVERNHGARLTGPNRVITSERAE